MFRKSRQHLSEVNEGYFQHMFFALNYAMGCLVAAFYAALHALIPGLCKNSASNKVRELYNQLEGRADNG